MTPHELKEKFAIEPRTEERDISDDELTTLLDGFKEDPNYIQNEEQDETTNWQKTKELELPPISKPKFTKYKNRITTDEAYRQKIEDRINNLIIKLENNEIKLTDLTQTDQEVILGILNENG